jgi:hypothetical protein
MTFVKAIRVATVLFLGATVAAYAQKEEKEAPEHAAPAKAPAQQHAPAAQHAQPAKAPAQAQKRETPPAAHGTPQAKAPAQQHAQPARPEGQQAKAPAKQPAQHEPQQAKAPVKQTPPHNAQQARAAAPAAQQHAPANLQQPAHTQQQAQNWQKQRGWASQGSWQPHTNFQQGRDRNWASDHRDWSQRGGYGGSYIPQASFGLYFGSAHFFHIGIMPVMYMGYPRFGYQGFSFMLVDPWPGAWQENWYASDDVFIDYDGGYYLHDRRYPGVRLAITVAL